MKWLRSSLEGAGLQRVRPIDFVLALCFISAILGLVIWAISGVAPLGLFSGLGAFGLGFEILATKARIRRRELTKLWPEVIDAISSAVVSGVSVADALAELAERGPTRLRPAFFGFSFRLDSGWQLADSLDWLKREFGDEHSDRLLEILRLVTQNGGSAINSILRVQAKQLRQDISQRAQIDSKQGWVVGTAKIAVAAPWLIVGMLSMRAENAAIYNSQSGIGILLLGFLISLFAYRLIHVLGALPQGERVFA